MITETKQFPHGAYTGTAPEPTDRREGGADGWETKTAGEWETGETVAPTGASASTGKEEGGIPDTSEPDRSDGQDMPDTAAALPEPSEEEFMAFTRQMGYYKCAMMAVETKFRILDEEAALARARNPIESIRTRLKSPRSIAEKLVRRGVAVTVDSIDSELHDVAGVRVICSFQSDVYALAEAFLRQDDVFLLEKKDYIQNPKPNGYRSLHLIVAVPIFLYNSKRYVTVEIQLRTLAMDCWASLEHRLRYKSAWGDQPETVRELNECAALSAALDAKMDALGRASLGKTAYDSEI